MIFKFLLPKSFSAFNQLTIEEVSEYKNMREKKSFAVVHTVNPTRNKWNYIEQNGSERIEYELI